MKTDDEIPNFVGLFLAQFIKELSDYLGVMGINDIYHVSFNFKPLQFDENGDCIGDGEEVVDNFKVHEKSTNKTIIIDKKIYE